MTQSPTSTTLTETPSAPGGNPTATLPPQSKATSGNGLTGTVSFYSGTALLGTATVANNTASSIATNLRP